MRSKATNSRPSPKAPSICCPSNSVIAENPLPIVPIGQEHRHPLLVRPIVAAELFHHLLLFLSSQERVCNDVMGKAVSEKSVGQCTTPSPKSARKMPVYCGWRIRA